MTSSPRRQSLRRRVLSTVAGGVLLTVVMVAALAVVSLQLRTQLLEESREIREEQRIADQIFGGVARQLALVAPVSAGLDPAFRSAFEAAGFEVHEGLRTYLFRDLSAEERIQVERIKERHEAMEVRALLTVQLLAADAAAESAAAAGQLREQVNGLLDALSEFLEMRGAEAEMLEARLNGMVRRLWLAAAASVLLLGAVVSLVLARFLTERVSTPLGALTAAATRIGEGDLAVRVPTDHDSEFVGLATEFNQMTGRLAAAQQVLAARNRELEEALEQLRVAQAELIQSEKLGAVGRMTAGLAHELNNPLASVLGFSELLAAELREREVVPVAVANSYLQPIVQEATRARMLVRSLLQFSRKGRVEVAPLPLRAALEVATELRRHEFAHGDLALVVEPIPEVAVMAEQQQLQGVIVNIMNNALDALAGRQGGRLRIHAAVEDTIVRLVFEDDGPGMREPDKVFDPFYTTKEVGEGTGLGLAIAERSIESFGGTIRAENRSEGGARFTIRLRVAPAAEAWAGPTAPALATSVAGNGRTVLVVEDEPQLRRLIAHALGRIGYSARLARSVPEAREAMTLGPVDGIISDVRMPGESGVEFFRWLEATHPSLAERFLFITGDINNAELAPIAQRRPDAVLLKPFDLHDLLARLQTVLAT